MQQKQWHDLQLFAVTNRPQDFEKLKSYKGWSHISFTSFWRNYFAKLALALYNLFERGGTFNGY